MKMLRVAIFAAAALSIAACGGRLYPAAQSPLSAPAEKPAAVTYRTLDNAADPTFNQLLGINDKGVIAGSYGSGASGHPNKGYVVKPPYDQSNYVDENYPGSVQTQVTGINLAGNTSCFWIDARGTNFGCILWNGVFSKIVNPRTGKGKYNQLLSINKSGVAAGFYTDAKEVNHGYTFDQASRTFVAVMPPKATNSTATGINDRGDVVGVYLDGKTLVGFLKTGSKYALLKYPGATGTFPLGINNAQQVVGAYYDANNNLHGFLVSNPLKGAKWQRFDAPGSRGETVVNALNNIGNLVGYYKDKRGRTHGMLVQL